MDALNATATPIATPRPLMPAASGRLGLAAPARSTLTRLFIGVYALMQNIRTKVSHEQTHYAVLNKSTTLPSQGRTVRIKIVTVSLRAETPTAVVIF